MTSKVFELTLSRWTADGENDDQIKWVEARSKEAVVFWIENSIDYPSEWGIPSDIRELDDYSGRDVTGIDFKLSYSEHLGAINEMLISAIEELCEYWDNGTPVHPGSMVSQEARFALKRALES